MKNENLLKNWAMAAVLGLFLGACAHQDGMQADNALQSDEAVASESGSLGDTASSGEAGSELAPLPGTSTADQDRQLSGDMENLGSGALSDNAAPGAEAVTPVATNDMPVTADVSSLSTTEPTLSAPTTEKKISKKRASKSAALVLPTTTVKQGDELLNRFYILRSGDTAESLSELFYGNKDKAANLKTWNSPKWKTGGVVFYLSPTQPADGEMRSFYSERGMVPTEYEVKKGDTLASIALATYGNKDSWKEIGLLNNIQSPTAVEPGSRLSLFPANLSGYSLKSENKPAGSSAQVDKQIDSLENQINKLEADIKKDAPSAAAPAEKMALEAGVVGSKPLLEDSEKKDLAAIGRERQKARVGHGSSDDDDADLASAEVSTFFQQNQGLILALIMAVAGIAVFVFIRRSRSDHDV